MSNKDTDIWSDFNNKTEAKKVKNTKNENNSEIIGFDFNNLFSRLNDFFKNKNLIIFTFIFLFFVIFLLLSSIYIVKPDENAAIIRLGKFVRVEESGLHFKLPYPLESSIIASVTSSRVIKIPFDRKNKNTKNTSMLTFDENIVNLEFEIHWKIKNLENFLFKVIEPEYTIYSATESITREIIGLHKLKDILTDAKSAIEMESKEKLQKLCDEYNLGVEIILLQMLRSDPPSEVISAFRDVQAAKIEKESIINKAQVLRNSIIPKAESDANNYLLEAQSYAVRTINEAKSKVVEFEKIYAEYKKNPITTKRRMYLETIGNFLENTKNLSIIDSSLKNIIFNNEVKYQKYSQNIKEKIKEDSSNEISESLKNQ